MPPIPGNEARGEAVVLAAAAAFRGVARRLRTLVAGITLLPLGYGLSTAFWYLMSNFGGGGVLSFQWVSFPGFVIFMVAGYVWTWFFGKPQPAEKVDGLTLLSLGQHRRDEQDENDAAV